MCHSISICEFDLINFMSVTRKAKRFTVVFIDSANGIPTCAALHEDTRLYMGGAEVDSKLRPGRHRRPCTVTPIPADDHLIPFANPVTPADSPFCLDSAPAVDLYSNQDWHAADGPEADASDWIFHAGDFEFE
jgi:hypothetical protein